MSSFDNAFGGSGGGNFRLYMEVYEESTNQAANQSTVRIILRFRKVSSTSIFNNTGDASWSANVDGQDYSGNFGWTSGMSVGSSIDLLNTTKVITHNTNGSRSVSYSGSANGNNGSLITTASGSGSQGLTDFPEPSVGSLSSSNIKISTATLSASVTSHGNGSSSTLTFFYRKQGAGSWTNAGTGSPKNLTGLLPGTTYQWYVNVTNNNGNSTDSSIQSFKTKTSGAFFKRVGAV